MKPSGMKPVLIGRHTLRTNTDAWVISRHPEVAAALGIPDGQVQVLLHDLLYHLHRHRDPEEITLPVKVKDAYGAVVDFRVHATPTVFTISRADDVLKIFRSVSACGSQLVSTVPAVQVAGAGVSISVGNLSPDRLRAVADVLQFGTSTAEPQLHEGESAAIDEAVMAKDEAQNVVDLAERFRAAEKAKNDEYQFFTDLFVLGPMPEKSARSPEALASLVADGLVEVSSGFAFLTRTGVDVATKGDQPKHKAEWHGRNRAARKQVAAAGVDVDVGSVIAKLEAEADGHTRRNLQAWDGFAGDLDLGVAHQHLDFWVIMSGQPTKVAFEYGRLRGIRDAMTALGIDPTTTKTGPSDGSLEGRGTLIQ